MPLFRRSSKRPKESSDGFAEHVPDVGVMQPVEQFHHAIARPTVDASRNFVIILVLLVIIVILGGALYRLMPLKTIQTHVIEVNGSTGEVSLRKDPAQDRSEYKPSQAVLDREIFNFARVLFTLNADAPAVVEEAHAIAYSTYARDRAAAQVREFVEKEQPYQRMQTTPGLARTVVKKTITYRADAPVALVRFSTAERQRGSTAPVMRNYAMQVTYAMLPPTEPAEIERNPLGLYITHFDIQEER